MSRLLVSNLFGGSVTEYAIAPPLGNVAPDFTITGPQLDARGATLSSGAGGPSSGTDRQRRARLQEAIVEPKTVQTFCAPSVVALSNP